MAPVKTGALKDIKRDKDGNVTYREWNVAWAYLGVPGTGKSTCAIADVMRECTPCIIIVHDPNWFVPEELPPGLGVKGKLNVKRYMSIEEAKRGIASDAGAIHCICIEDAADVIELAKRVGEASIIRGGGDKGIPVIVVIDEIVMAHDASPHRLGKEFRKLLAQRRHYHLGLVYTTQHPHYCHYSLLAMANRVKMFRLTDVRSRRALMNASIDEQHLAKLASLPDHQCIETFPGQVSGKAPSPTVVSKKKK